MCIRDRFIISSIFGLQINSDSRGLPNLLSIFAPRDIHRPFLILRFDNSTTKNKVIG